MATSKRHDDHGPIVKATLTTKLAADEKAQNTGNVEVTMLWGGSVMGVRRVSGQGAIKIGHAPGNDFQVSHPSIPSPAYELVKLSKDGLVYVCDRVNNRIQVFNKNGTYVKEGCISQQI